MADSDDFLVGTEIIAKAFHKNLRGHHILLDFVSGGKEKTVLMRIGNYSVTLLIDESESSLNSIALRVQNVSDAT